MTREEQEFERELDVFRVEVESGIQFFYAHMTLSRVVAANTRLLAQLNRAPVLWRTIIGSLQSSWFMTLGRIFDQGSPHNVDRVLNLASMHIHIFSPGALAVRKQGNLPAPPSWLPAYLRRVYQPSSDDFRKLRRMVDRRRRGYVANYRAIRHQVYGHKIETSEANLNALFARTNVRELELMFTFLKQLHVALQELYSNGRKPVIRPMRYSTEAIRRRRRVLGIARTVQELIVEDTMTYFRELAQQGVVADGSRLHFGPTVPRAVIRRR